MEHIFAAEQLAVTSVTAAREVFWYRRPSPGMKDVTNAHIPAFKQGLGRVLLAHLGG